ncbi:MAG: TIGR03032 family protein [Flavobacteriales bacterium]|nr:TIGR03032 family protein [Flavobacteriales bacterium]
MEKDLLNIDFDAKILDVLEEIEASVVFSTYQAGKLLVLGSNNSKLTQIPFNFKKPMGIAIQDAKIAVATIDSIEFLSNKEEVAKTVKENVNEFDTFFIHRASYNTGNLDIHDIDFGDSQLWGVNTAFSCLCVFDINYNFVPRWKPDYITELVPEDRCHLNGMAIENSKPKYVTALSVTDHKDGWREKIMETGVLMEVPSSRIICDKLAMPHSPRIIDGELYLLESGAGKLLKIDTETGEKEVVHDFGLFIRGMSYHKGYLFIGKSKIRESSKTFNYLEVKDKSSHAGLIVYDLKNRSVVGQLDYLDTIDEIFDVQVIPGFKKPAFINRNQEMAKRIITFKGNVFWRADLPKDEEKE